MRHAIAPITRGIVAPTLIVLALAGATPPVAHAQGLSDYLPQVSIPNPIDGLANTISGTFNRAGGGGPGGVGGGGGPGGGPMLMQTTPIARTSNGLVQGLIADNVAHYLGIPYAAPPVGKLRWQPPRPPADWPGTLKVDHFGNSCPAGPRGVFASPSTTEDCLYLNIFTPRTIDPRGPHRPVLVWFHGGGLYSGESNDYDGSAMAAHGDAVVVTLNYRVGALGFLSHPALNAEGHPFANYGIMDQQFALAWVKTNIAAFGGDAANITIVGQSGGGTSVMANLVSPTAAGLFQRAINQSGTHIDPYPPELALQSARDFATEAGCADQSAECLRALPVEAVLQHQAGLVKNIAANFPVVDGTVVAATPMAAFTTGRFNRVPILTGLVADEQAFFLPEASGGPVFTKDEYLSHVASFGEVAAKRLLARYPLDQYASPSLADIDLMQGYKACTARTLNRAWARYVPVYAYQFNDRSAPSYFPATSYPMRAYHTAELQYLFLGFHGGQGTPHRLTAGQNKLATQMQIYWTEFARHGDPNGRSAHQSYWPRYSATDDVVQSFEANVVRPVSNYGQANNCDLWNSIIAPK